MVHRPGISVRLGGGRLRRLRTASPISQRSRGRAHNRYRPAVRFLDLGTLEIDIGGCRTVLGGKRPGRVLSALLMQVNRRVSIELLLDAVWGEGVSEGASGTLETHVWRLRRLLEPDRAPGRPATVLLNESAGYRLNVSVDSVDSARFEQVVCSVSPCSAPCSRISRATPVPPPASASPPC